MADHKPRRNIFHTVTYTSKITISLLDLAPQVDLLFTNIIVSPHPIARLNKKTFRSHPGAFRKRSSSRNLQRCNLSDTPFPPQTWQSMAHLISECSAVRGDAALERLPQNSV
ncbi:hypothetical protein WA026_023611 [Henosepilachna vigintioctopunctata]|uniref:Uncharacterized protein n=1 Tax=Henosepilachna vigintioctopunctata TaxID=420089 RepID=A0AAW1TY86_9CUCU